MASSENGGQFSSQSQLIKELRAEGIKVNSNDLGPAIIRLERDGRLVPVVKGQSRGGMLSELDHSSTAPDSPREVGPMTALFHLSTSLGTKNPESRGVINPSPERSREVPESRGVRLYPRAVGTSGQDVVRRGSRRLERVPAARWLHTTPAP